MRDFREVEFSRRTAFEDVQHVRAGRLEMRGGIVGFRDEDLRLAAQVHRLVHVRDTDKPTNPHTFTL